MTDLIPVPPNELTALTGCSPALWTRLTSNPDRLGWFERIEAMQRDQQIVAEVRSALPKIQAFGRAATPKEAIAILARMVPLYGVSDRSQAEWSTFWGFYLETLGAVPVRALKAACSEYVAAPDSQFFPKPGPLKAICDRHAAPINAVVRMAERVAMGHDGSGQMAGSAA